MERSNLYPINTLFFILGIDMAGGEHGHLREAREQAQANRKNIVDMRIKGRGK